MTSRTYQQFCRLGVEATYTGPFSFEVREPRDTNPTGNYYASRGEFEEDLLGVIIHITAGLESFSGADNSAEATDAWGKTTSSASWPGIVDSDSIINSLHPKRVAFLHGVQGYNFNRPLFGLEIAKRHTDWRNMPQPWVDATLRNAAAYIAPVVLKHNIPLRVMTNRDEIQRLINAKQKVGFAEHWNLTPTTRADAGRVGSITTWPWDRFFAFLRIELDRLRGVPASVPPPAPTKLTVRKGTVLEVTAIELNARSGPSTNHRIVGPVAKGLKLVATGKTNGAWVQAQTPYQVKNKLTGSWFNTAWLKVVSQPPIPKPAPSTPALPVLKRGSTGPLVGKLQKFAMTNYPAYSDSIKFSGGADESFGAGTERWVMEFQRRSNLVPDGAVGPRTWPVLLKAGFKP